MKIGIDISRTVEESTGVGYYAKNLVHALAAIDPGDEYLLYGIFCDCYPKNWKKADVPKARNFSLHQRWYPSRYVMRQWMNFAKKRNQLLGGVDVLHSTAFTMPLVSRVKVIVTIHDLSFFHYPQHHTDANYRFVNRNVHLAARRADLIIADSVSTKRDIQRFLHVPDKKIEVVYLASGESFSARRSSEDIERVKNKYKIRKPYFLAVGSIEPRKNLARALVAFKALIEMGRVDYQCIIVGGQGWKNEAFYALLRKLDIDEHLVFTGYVPEEDLPLLYQGAGVFLYPSVYEGFGLPVLEAMSSGVPVITSKTSSLPEVAGDAALLVNPLDIFELYEAMEALATKPQLRKELALKGLEQSKKFSWEKTAQKTLEIYKRVFDNGERSYNSG